MAKKQVAVGKATIPVKLAISIGLQGSQFGYSVQTATPLVKKKSAARPARTLRASAGQELQWKCSKPTSILFDPVSPCGRLYYSNGDASSPDLVDIKKNPPGPLRGAGRFKYIVAVWDGKKVAIDDPDIIVEY
jgi:hypothetical protein